LLLVRYSAVLADLPVGARERDVPHLDHGPDEIAEEPLAITAVGLHQILCAGDAFRAGEETLVGGQEALLRQEVLVIVVVEHVGGGDVERRGLVAVAACTEALEAIGEAGLQRRVG